MDLLVVRVKARVFNHFAWCDEMKRKKKKGKVGEEEEEEEKNFSGICTPLPLPPPSGGVTR